MQRKQYIESEIKRMCSTFWKNISPEFSSAND